MSVKRYHWAVDGMWDSYGNGPPAYYGDDGEFVVFRRGNEWVRAEDYDALQARNKKSEAENKRLKKALEPFARANKIASERSSGTD